MAELYFAYASNMSSAQMADRCKSHRFIGIGRLEAYELIFPIYSKKRWGGGVAGVRPAEGNAVYGVLYELSPADLRTLDGFEGVSFGRYRREAMDVLTGTNGRFVRAWVYIPDDTGEHYAPSAAYLNTIIAGATEHNLPGDYIDRLREIDTVKPHSARPQSGQERSGSD